DRPAHLTCAHRDMSKRLWAVISIWLLGTFNICVYARIGPSGYRSDVGFVPCAAHEEYISSSRRLGETAQESCWRMLACLARP
ncbi:hypothetical protein PanWU01x14_214910, partial [Parasponia andersonii]